MSKEIELCIGSVGHRGRNEHWIFPFKEEDLKEYLPPFANQLSEVSKKAGLEYKHKKPIFIITSSAFFSDVAPERERMIMTRYPSIDVARVFENKGLVKLTPSFVYESIEKSVFETAERYWYKTYDLFTFLKHAKWKTSLYFELRRLGRLNISDPNDVFVVSDDASFNYHFNENQMFERLSCTSAKFGTPAVITGGSAISISSMILPEEEIENFGPLKVWSIENDYILPKYASKELKEQIIKDGKREFTSYDNIITLYFGDGCGIPLTKDLQNINLETMVMQIVPKILEKMIDFVEN